MIDFWDGKRVLISGHTGFKGAWMSLWLHRLGAKVTGISLAPTASPNLFSLTNVHSITDSNFCDIRDFAKLASLIKKAQPEIVFHLAAQALVPTSYRDPLATFETNVQGTANLLEAMRSIETVRSLVCITTDKVYKNMEQLFPYREKDILGGHDPYSASKAASEIVIASYRDSFLSAKGVAVASARAGNVIGGGDWSANRLIPDAILAWSVNKPLQIRRPEATRPWQHVLEPLFGYFQLAQSLWHQPNLAGAYNFGPQTQEVASVRKVVELAQEAFGKGQVEWGDGKSGHHEAGLLALETVKARTLLGVSPRWALEEAVLHTINWYRQYHDGANALELCMADIEAFNLTDPFVMNL